MAGSQVADLTFGAPQLYILCGTGTEKNNKNTSSINFLKSQSGCNLRVHAQTGNVWNSLCFNVERGLAETFWVREKASFSGALLLGIRPEKFMFMLSFLH